MNPEISILIITHNQRLLLERCLDSVLNQIINVPYEIIVSDDGVDDGTENFFKQLCCSERVTGKKNLIELKYVYCSNERASGRIGWNRLTAYNQARGKYFVNVDADDFLIGTDLYQKEYEMLESHHECSMVQTRLLLLDDGDSIEKIKKGYPFSEKLENAAKFPLEDVIRFKLIGQHQTYMYRRRPQDDMVRLLGGNFDDYQITYYHLQFGPVVFLDMSGYVWVQYHYSSSHSLTNDEKMFFVGLLPLRLAMLGTAFENSKYILLSSGIGWFAYLIKIPPRYPELSENRRKEWSIDNAFLWRFFSEHHHSVSSWVRYVTIWLLLLVMKRRKVNSKFWLDVLYRAMVKDRLIVFKARWIWEKIKIRLR
jgi:glycosyltransferase involved in cell wall biosynthesis